MYQRDKEKLPMKKWNILEKITYEEVKYPDETPI